VTIWPRRITIGQNDKKREHFVLLASQWLSRVCPGCILTMWIFHESVFLATNELSAKRTLIYKQWNKQLQRNQLRAPCPLSVDQAVSSIGLSLQCDEPVPAPSRTMRPYRVTSNWGLVQRYDTAPLAAG